MATPPSNAPAQDSNGTRVLVVGGRFMVRAHIHDQLRGFHAAWGAETVQEALDWLAKDAHSTGLPPPVLVLLGTSLQEGLGLFTILRSRMEEPVAPVLLLVEEPDVPKVLDVLPEDVIRGRYDRMDLVLRVRALGMLAQARRDVADARERIHESHAVVDEWRHALAAETATTSTLARFVSPAVMDAVRSGEANARPQQVQMSVLFSDIRGFTDATAFCTPEDTIDLLNDYLPEVNRLISEHGGLLDKFMGDGILAYFPNNHPNHHAQRAVLAAVAIQERLEELKVTWFERGFLPVGVGVGITTGTVTLGTIGEGPRVDFTVIGSSVNLAARLQGLAKGGDIVVDDATFQHIRQVIQVQDPRRVSVKGFEEPVMVYSVAYHDHAMPMLPPARN